MYKSLKRRRSVKVNKSQNKKFSKLNKKTVKRKSTKKNKRKTVKRKTKPHQKRQYKKRNHNLKKTQFGGETFNYKAYENSNSECERMNIDNEMDNEINYHLNIFELGNTSKLKKITNVLVKIEKNSTDDTYIIKQKTRTGEINIGSIDNDSIIQLNLTEPKEPTEHTEPTESFIIIKTPKWNKFTIKDNAILYKWSLLKTPPTEIQRIKGFNCINK
jgi:hypothetical protein